MKNCIYLFASLLLLSCSDNQSTIDTPYNPGEPITLDSFYPETGGRGTDVILKGANFGNNPADVKVYFNQKQAYVISAKGSMIYTKAPRLPGDTCYISVVVGEDSTVYKNTFSYEVMSKVSTIVGGVHTDSVMSNPMDEEGIELSTAQFGEGLRGICVDASDNLYMAAGKDVYQLNVEGDFIRHIWNVGGFMGACVNPATDLEQGKIFVSCAAFPKSQTYYSIVDQGIGGKDVIFSDGKEASGWRYSCVAHPVTGMMYYLTNESQLVCFDPNTLEGQIVDSKCGPGGDVPGMLIDKEHPDSLFFSLTDKHAIYLYRFSSKALTVYAGKQGVAGNADGKLQDAEFNCPCQMCYDENGNIMVADRENHCIRRIKKEGFVETVAGVSGTSGYRDGRAETALFNQPLGITMDSQNVFYITEDYNRAVRRLAIE